LDSFACLVVRNTTYVNYANGVFFISKACLVAYFTSSKVCKAPPRSGGFMQWCCRSVRLSVCTFIRLYIVTALPVVAATKGAPYVSSRWKTMPRQNLWLWWGLTCGLHRCATHTFNVQSSDKMSIGSAHLVSINNFSNCCLYYFFLNAISEHSAVTSILFRLDILEFGW